MMAVLIVLGAGFGLMFATWFHYLAIMSLQHVRKTSTLNPWAYRFGMLILGAGYLLDFLSNILPLTVLMLEPPHELLVSARVSRHQRVNASWQDAKGLRRYIMKWRYSVAVWTCKNLLDPFDPSGCHCK